MQPEPTTRFLRVFRYHAILTGLLVLLGAAQPTLGQASSFTVAEGSTHNGVVAIGDPTYSLATAPSHGTLVFNADGVFSYTAHRQPTLGFVGSDAFQYQSSDQGSGDEPHTVSITITPVNDAPVALSKSFTVLLGNTYNGQVEATDVDGDALNYSLVTAPVNGTLTFNFNGSFSYQPTLPGDGADSFTFKANDGLADSNTATVDIVILQDPLFFDRFEFSDAGGTLTCPEDDDFEPNDDLETATPITPGTALRAIICSGNPDHFQFSANDGDQLDILATFSHADGDLDMDLFKEDGTLVGFSDSGSDDEFISYIVPAGEAGDYIVRVFGFGETSNTYDLQVDIIPADD